MTTSKPNEDEKTLMSQDGINVMRIFFSGSVESDSFATVKEILRNIKRLDCLEDFNNKIVDIDDEEEPVISYSTEVSEGSHDTFTIAPVPDPEKARKLADQSAPVKGTDDFEENFLAITSSFSFDSINLLEDAIGEILDHIDQINIRDLTVGYRIDMPFLELETISRMNDVSQPKIDSVQFSEGPFAYFLADRGEEDETQALVFLDEESTIDADSFEGYFHARIEDFTPFLEKVCYDE